MTTAGSGPTLARFAEKREEHGSGGNPMEKNRRNGGMAGARSNRAWRAFEWIALSVWLFAPAVMAAENYEVTVERNVAAKMRDGVTLRADIYRPKADGKYPVLLVRTPYDKPGTLHFGLTAAARGYVGIRQGGRS